MSETTEPAVEAVGRSRILPVVRTQTADHAHRLVTTLVTAGIGVVEVTATIPGWSEVLEAATAEYPLCVVGAGTITTAVAAEQALERGARFLVSPYPAPEVRSVAARARTLFIEGGFTPSEVAAAASQGVAKLFPAHVAGPAYLRSLLAVVPGARVVPTGGIPLDDVPRWLAAGAFAVGVGNDLFSGDLPERLASLGIGGSA